MTRKTTALEPTPRGSPGAANVSNAIPSCRIRQRQPGPPLNPYYFVEQLSAKLADDDVIVCGNATSCIVPFQTMRLRKNQRLISNSGSASMGYDLPAAIGAAFARPGSVSSVSPEMAASK